MRASLFGAVSCILLATPAIAADYVDNGGFDDVTNFTPNDSSGAMRLTPGSTALTGWVVAGGTVLWIGPDGVGEGSPLRGAGLVNAVALRDAADSILQIIDSLPELTRFEVRVAAGTDDRDRVRSVLDELLVSVDGAEQSGQTVETGPDGRATIRFDFLARSSRVVLRLNGRGSDGSGFYGVVDGVSIAAVPEPMSWAMMIGGFGLVGGAMRVRRARGTVAA